MKTLKSLLVVLIISMVSMSSAFAEEKKDDKSKKETVTFSMTLHGEHCEKIIMKSIPFEKGVLKVKAEAAKQEVEVTFNPKKTNKENLIKAFKKNGFEAKEVTEKDKAKTVAPCCSHDH